MKKLVLLGIAGILTIFGMTGLISGSAEEAVEEISWCYVPEIEIPENTDCPNYEGFASA